MPHSGASAKKANAVQNQNELFVTDAATDPVILTISKYDNNDYDDYVEGDSESECAVVNETSISHAKTPANLDR